MEPNGLAPLLAPEVERRLSAVDELEATVAADLTRADRLRQAILHRAFAGELVPQDPSDESASALLERITVDRLKQVMSPSPQSRAGSRRGNHPPERTSLTA